MLKYRCRDCDAEFSEEAIKNYSVCPACGSIKFPLDISQDILLYLNWYEIRCLTIWASNWLENFDDSEINDTKIWFQKLLNKIHKYKPEGGGSLTIAQEVKELQKEFPNLELYDENGNIIIPKKEEME